jgi:hypothetical protein
LKTIASRAVLACLLLVVLGAVGVWATENPRELIQAYRIWKLTDALGLSEEQMPLFFAKIKLIDRRDAELRGEELKALDEIRHLLGKEGVSDSDLQRAFAAYDEIRTRRMQELAGLRREAAGLLSARQRCEYVVFEERFKANIKEMIGRVREINKQGALQGRSPGAGEGESGRPADPGAGRPADPGAGRSAPQGTGRGRR